MKNKLVGRPKGTINNLQELQNIVLMGLDLYYVGPDSELRHYEELTLKPGESGLMLHSLSAPPKYVEYCGIYDKTFRLRGTVHQEGYLFNSREDAMAWSMVVFKDRAFHRVPA